MKHRPRSFRHVHPTACAGNLALTVNGEVGAVENMPLVNLLWTGGWDSTFRLLSLISSRSCMVQPYYVISRARPSWRIEIQTMEEIRSACLRSPVKYVGRILPTIFAKADDVAEDQHIVQSHARLMKRTHIGEQYKFLAAFAKQYKINGLELAIHIRDALYDLLCEQVELRESAATWIYALKDDTDDDVKSVFKYFSFPVFHLTKRQMEKLAGEQDFLDVLEISWFCHRPVGNAHPCGTCPPCRATILNGLSRRVGWRGVLRHHARTTAQRVFPNATIRAVGARLRRRRKSGADHGLLPESQSA
jgi:hypothetical protein